MLRMNNTKNDLKASTRKKVTELLNQTLACSSRRTSPITSAFGAMKTSSASWGVWPPAAVTGIVPPGSLSVSKAGVRERVLGADVSPMIPQNLPCFGTGVTSSSTIAPLRATCFDGRVDLHTLPWGPIIPTAPW